MLAAVSSPHLFDHTKDLTPRNQISQVQELLLLPLFETGTFLALQWWMMRRDFSNITVSTRNTWHHCLISNSATQKRQFVWRTWTRTSFFPQFEGHCCSRFSCSGRTAALLPAAALSCPPPVLQQQAVPAVLIHQIWLFTPFFFLKKKSRQNQAFYKFIFIRIYVYIYIYPQSN